MEQIGSPEIEPYKYSQLVFDKGTKGIKWSKDSVFSKWCWNNWTSTCKKMNLNTNLRPFTKNSSKWILDLNVKCKTFIKLLEDNIGENLDDLGYGDAFLDTTPKTRFMK